MSEPEVVFRLESVTKEFGNGRSLLGLNRSAGVRALDDVSIELRRGEVLGLVGESGSGKTTLGRILVGAERATSGRVWFEGTPVEALRGGALRNFRKSVQMVFQNPFTSLNPRRTVRDVLNSGFAARGLRRGAQRAAAMAELMPKVGLSEAFLDRYPHAFSGGQRQRIVLARALTVEPSVLVADEPVSALDVSIQAQILNLFVTLRRELNLSIVMITHDLRVANFLSDRIAVLYRGQLVELGTREQIMEHSRHPYTRMLLSAAPTGDPDAPHNRPWLVGDATPADAMSGGCVFRDRCWLRTIVSDPDRCATEQPRLAAMEDQHSAACHFAEQTATAAGVLLVEAEESA
ncbi:ABC transporter ATP-binding protein [Actinacidiphila oryziradicis]|uniref:ABC transporter ATP-binding protein n=1 Tax=Actinacidiphila oryziradicis TaxID=2571141 RepID=A0A4V5MXQ8_9ACTN|nr:oligopeptide/dipeptide ABC transporter ATP-binding protein [Actinacidiphila oryziradicis]TKA01179.1 ABC transporter ATP-binding protein [Actinacidiphila oryziradicis]